MQGKNLKKSYKFALRTALYVTLFTTVLVSAFLHFYHAINWHLVFYPLLCFPLCFFIIQYRVERFIYKRVKKIYDDLTLLESTSLRQQPITTDMGTLTKEIDKYAKNKKFEIETLKIREEYRKEFIGNVSHELKTPLFTVQSYLLTLLDGGIEDEKISFSNTFSIISNSNNSFVFNKVLYTNFCSPFFTSVFNRVNNKVG